MTNIRLAAATMAAAIGLGSAALCPLTANATPPSRSYTIGGDVTIVVHWGPASCIQLNWPTASQAVCNPTGVFVARQYNVRPGQLIGVDPVISGNTFASCGIIDEVTGNVIEQDGGTLGDGYDINCLTNTY